MAVLPFRQRIAWFLSLPAWLFIRRITGKEHLPAGPCVIASSHGSYLDGAMLFQALWPRPQRPIAGGWFRRHPVFFPLLWLGHCIWTGGTAVRDSLAALADGSTIVIFPEGGFSDNTLRNPRKGAARIALLGKVPLIPVRLKDSHRIKNGTRATIAIGKPLSTARYDPEDPADWQRLTDRLKEAINAL